MTQNEHNLHLRNLDLQFPKEVEWAKEYIVLKPFKPFGVSKEYPMIPLFSIPVEVSCLADKIVYRIIPLYPNVMVSKIGFVRDTRTTEILNPHLLGNYKRVYITKNEKRLTKSVHRLVALGWVKNDDFVENNVVDHIDNNKLNNVASNLRWVPMSLNASRVKNIVDKRWWVKKIGSDVIHKFASLTEVGMFFRKNKNAYSATRAPFKVKTSIGTFIVEDVLNFKGWSLEVKDGKPLVIKKIRLLHIKSGKTLVFNTSKEVCEFLNVSKAAVGYRFKYRKGVPINGYVLAINDEEFPVIKDRPRQKSVVLDNGVEIKRFDSLRKASEFLNVDRKTLTKKDEINGYKINIG